MRLLWLTVLLAGSTAAQEPVEIRVHARESLGPYQPIYGYFGYDEPNYTYTPNGRKLLGELGRLGQAPVYVRTHFLLATGDGKPGLKWGSTNAYTEDAQGRPVYDWTTVDRIFDAYLQAGMKPFVEIGFMPRALSAQPEPYQVPWIPGAKNEGYSAGWSYPPKKFAKWRELVRQWVSHCVAKYGREEAASWYWEVWNEPDISYWHGTPEEYDTLYDFAADGVKQALPQARIGGPATTGPANAKAAAYLRQFLEHCATGRNLATGKTGSPLDFITFHAKGRPTVVEGQVRMGLAKELQDVDEGLRIVASFPHFQRLPIVLSESDPEGCAACSARVYPQNAYRNGTLYPAYTAVMLKSIFELAGERKTNIAGMLTWAFEFEDQPYFDGFRTLATNGIDKPVLNVFRMAARLSGDRVRTESSGAVPFDELRRNGVRGRTDVDALATRAERQIAVLAWNYRDDEAPGPSAPVRLRIDGLPEGLRSATVRHYRIDEKHSNAYAEWKAMGAPQQLDAGARERLERSGALTELTPATRLAVDAEKAAELAFTLPGQSVSLVVVNW